MTPNFSPPRLGLPMVPVTLAGVGRGMIRLAGELCDGIALHPFCTRRYLDRVDLPDLREAHAVTHLTPDGASGWASFPAGNPGRLPR